MDSLVWLAIPLGAALIFVSLLDMDLTVLHIQTESPVSVLLNRAVWNLMLRVSGVLPLERAQPPTGVGLPDHGGHHHRAVDARNLNYPVEEVWAAYGREARDTELEDPA